MYRASIVTEHETGSSLQNTSSNTLHPRPVDSLWFRREKQQPERQWEPNTSAKAPTDVTRNPI